MTPEANNGRAEQAGQMNESLNALRSAPLSDQEKGKLIETLKPLIDEIDVARADIDDVLNMRVQGVSDEEIAEALQEREKSIQNLARTFSELAEALKKRSEEIQKYL